MVEHQPARSGQVPGVAHDDLEFPLRPFVAQSDRPKVHSCTNDVECTIRNEADTHVRLYHPAHRVETGHVDAQPHRLARLGGRAWCSRASPAGVRVMPFESRSNRVTPNASSKSAIRLLTADAAMPSRAAARVRFFSSQTAVNSRNVVRSIRRSRAFSPVLPLRVRFGARFVASRDIATSCRSAGDVIPGWSEGPDPESRDSGFALRAPRNDVS